MRSTLLLVAMLALAGCASRPKTSTTTVTAAPGAWQPKSIALHVAEEKPDPCAAGGALFVGFRQGSAEIEPDSVLAIDRLARCAAARGSTVELVASVDPIEARQVGPNLARKRAAVVRARLAEGGVPRGKVSVLSAGRRDVPPARAASARSVEIVLDRTKPSSAIRR